MVGTHLHSLVCRAAVKGNRVQHPMIRQGKFFSEIILFSLELILINRNIIRYSVIGHGRKGKFLQQSLHDIGIRTDLKYAVSDQLTCTGHIAADLQAALIRNLQRAALRNIHAVNNQAVTFAFIPKRLFAVNRHI